jgi:hypothetical protein
MLSRAKCTIYHVQESDTLGKDSELAATLAQGKPVIAFIPEIPAFEKFKEETIEQINYSIESSQKYTNIRDGLLARLKRYYPEGAWEDETIQGWIKNTDIIDEISILDILHKKVTQTYEKRAKTLREAHPLGLQVNIFTGVANGVLVVRNMDDCAKLLRKIILNDVDYDIEDSESNNVILRETITQCVYRVSTGNDLLTNSFWNFYGKDRRHVI